MAVVSVRAIMALTKLIELESKHIDLFVVIVTVSKLSF